jgi:curli production assembly/transport CsgH protein
MSNTQKQFIAVVATIFAAMGTAGFAMGENDVTSEVGSKVSSEAGSEVEASHEPVRCEIQAIPDNGGIILEGVVHAEMQIKGSYRFQVVTTSRAGNSNVSQGGYFSVGPDDPITLGKVMVGNRNAAYDVNLEVTTDGETIECVRRIDGVI